jgi:hypothetical protein
MNSATVDFHGIEPVQTMLIISQFRNLRRTLHYSDLRQNIYRTHY